MKEVKKMKENDDEKNKPDVVTIGSWVIVITAIIVVIIMRLTIKY